MAISRMQQPQQMQGGIGSLQDPRQGYFLGKLVKKATRAVKKVVKSPLGKDGFNRWSWCIMMVVTGTSGLLRFKQKFSLALGVKGIGSALGTCGKLSTVKFI
jgi:hypothetical protein